MLLFKSNSLYKSLKISILLLIICFPLSYQNVLLSQVSVDSYVEIGGNGVSQGVYGNFSAQVSARLKTIKVSTGGLLSFSNTGVNIFEAYSLALSNDFLIRKRKITIGAFYRWKPFSIDLRQTTFGLLAHYRTNHIGYSMGLNSRIYSFSHASIVRNNFADTIVTSYREPINFMYKLSFYRKFNSKFDLEASITNYDRYFILQETNPMILTKLNYNYNAKLQFYSELGYLQAGLLNFRVNYYGIYCRGGIIWHI